MTSFEASGASPARDGDTRAEHADWCNFVRHGDCCHDDCDCGAGAVNAEIDRLRAENERISGAWADAIQQTQLADNAWRYDLDVVTAERDAAVAALNQVRALHQPEMVWLSPFSDERGPQCTHCRGDDWPCSTVAAADAPEAPQ